MDVNIKVSMCWIEKKDQILESIRNLEIKLYYFCRRNKILEECNF